MPALLDMMVVRRSGVWPGGRGLRPTGRAMSLGIMKTTASGAQQRASGRGVILTWYQWPFSNTTMATVLGMLCLRSSACASCPAVCA